MKDSADRKQPHGLVFVENAREGLAFERRRVFAQDSNRKLGYMAVCSVGRCLVKAVTKREKIAKSESKTKPDGCAAPVEGNHALVELRSSQCQREVPVVIKRVASLRSSSKRAFSGFCVENVRKLLPSCLEFDHRCRRQYLAPPLSAMFMCHLKHEGQRACALAPLFLCSSVILCSDYRTLLPLRLPRILGDAVDARHRRMRSVPCRPAACCLLFAVPDSILFRAVSFELLQHIPEEDRLKGQDLSSFDAALCSFEAALPSVIKPPTFIENICQQMQYVHEKLVRDIEQRGSATDAKDKNLLRFGRACLARGLPVSQ